MDLRIIVGALCVGLSMAQPPPFSYMDGMDEMQCPAMDCTFVDRFLECDAVDRYTPRMMMYGMECSVCAKCRTYTYYRSLLESTVQSMQKMFQKTIIMQNFLDENSNVIQSISEVPATPVVVGTFYGLLNRNAETLRSYLALDPTDVVEFLMASAKKLNDVLSGSSVKHMTGIMDDYSKEQVNNKINDMDEIVNSLGLAELLTLIQQQLRDLTSNHDMIKTAIEKIEPTLLTLLDLTQADFDTIWENDNTTLRVAFKLLEKSEEAIRSLLHMNMDTTASALKRVIMQEYESLLAIWETPSQDLGGHGNNDTNHGQGNSKPGGSRESGTDENDLDGSGDEDEDSEEPQKITENNFFFQWLSSRYIK